MDENNINSIDMEAVGRMLNNVMETADFPYELATISDEAVNIMFDRTKKFVGTIVEYKELMMMYTCAMKEIRTKFDVLNTEFNIRYQRNPIQFINTRLKRTASIAEKLERNNLDFSVDSIEKNINDVAGVRVICSYIDDIYSVADMLVRQDDIKLIKRKDYISNPKPNGYRSLHLIVSVPVFFAEHKKEIKVEVQIRTIAMDFWASLEHQLKYKHDVANQENIVEQLKSCADVISDTDEKMLSIRKQIENTSDIPSDDDILIEKIKKIDIPLS